VSSPVDAFAVFASTVSSLASVSWLERGLSLQAQAPTFLAFVIAAVIVSCGPLLLFSRKLYRSRHREESSYHALAREYVDAFRTKWLAPEQPAVLGTADIQSLNDLGGAYRTADSTRIYPFGPRTIINLWAGALAPMVPLILATTPIVEVATHFGKMLFGVAP